MTRQELAEKLNITRNTLTNWEKEKPELIRLINQGLALDEQISEIKKFLEKLEKIKEKASNNKINLKELGQ
ncbi:helix-turn-helix domain-containing protein [Campylobacter curvus]|uniref:helix-turn-helix domain-containing protein n=1 Tax=Campylobacter curvus TaxID=200 RepID=UPI00146FE84B|nr:helix-turn-helix domain-containing protein [Campylobacter curvus]